MWRHVLRLYFSFFGRGKLKHAIIIALLLTITIPVVFSQSVSGDDTLLGEGGVETEDPVLENEPQGADGINESELTLSFTDEVTSPADENPGVFGFWDLIRMVLVLALVLGMIYATYFFLKRNRKRQEEESNFISLLTSQALPGEGSFI